MANETTPNGNNGPQHNKYYKSLNEFITAADIALTNAQLPDIQPLLQKVGYPAADIAEKLADLQALRALDLQQQKEYGDQYKAFADYQKQVDRLNADYVAHVEMARIEFEDDPAALTTLGLNGRRLHTKADYSKQALQLYNGIKNNTDYAATLAAAGIDAATVTAMQAGFTNLEALDKAQTKEMGEAQEATAKRDKAWDILDSWMSKFYRKAKIALKNYPQMREKLGLIER